MQTIKLSKSIEILRVILLLSITFNVGYLCYYMYPSILFLIKKGFPDFLILLIDLLYHLVIPILIGISIFKRKSEYLHFWLISSSLVVFFSLLSILSNLLVFNSHIRFSFLQYLTISMLLVLVVYLFKLNKTGDFNFSSNRLIHNKSIRTLMHVAVLSFGLLGAIPVILMLSWSSFNNLRSWIEFLLPILPFFMVLVFWIMSWFKKPVYLLVAYFTYLAYVFSVHRKFDFFIVQLFSHPLQSSNMGFFPNLSFLGWFFLTGYIFLIITGVWILVLLKLDKNKLQDKTV